MLSLMCYLFSVIFFGLLHVCMFISYNIVLIFKYDLSFSIDRHTSYLKDFAYIICSRGNFDHDFKYF